MAKKIPPPRNPEPGKCKHATTKKGPWYWSAQLGKHWRSVTCANPRCKKKLPNEIEK